MASMKNADQTLFKTVLWFKSVFLCCEMFLDKDVYMEILNTNVNYLQ